MSACSPWIAAVSGQREKILTSTFTLCRALLVDIKLFQKIFVV